MNSWRQPRIFSRGVSICLIVTSFVGMCQTKSTVELALSHPDQSLSISDLARQNGVPERSLRTAFQRCYGLSPMEYLRIHRLHRARGLLRELSRRDDRHPDCLRTGFLGCRAVRRCLSSTVRGTSFRDASEARSGTDPLNPSPILNPVFPEPAQGEYMLRDLASRHSSGVHDHVVFAVWLERERTAAPGVRGP